VGLRHQLSFLGDTVGCAFGLTRPKANYRFLAFATCSAVTTGAALPKELRM
jgi:hypothetical protein